MKTKFHHITNMDGGIYLTKNNVFDMTSISGKEGVLVEVVTIHPRMNVAVVKEE